MNVVDAPLRLSAQRALLGAIPAQARLIKVKRNGSTIRLTVLAAEPLSDAAKDALSTASTEMIADFPDCRIDEELLVTTGPLPIEDVLVEGWIYQRTEPARIDQDRLEVWHDGSAICVIAVGSHGDPLDLGEHEVEGLIAKLQDALARGRT
jgi:hypothetical protein